MSAPINLDAVRRAHARFIGKQQVAVIRCLDEAGKFAEDHVTAHSRFKRRSPVGQSLKDATAHKFIRTGSGVVMRVYSTKATAPILEHGSKPHVIRARKASALRFVIGGKTIFRRKVNHPGTSGFRFLYHATNAGFRILGQQLERDLGALAKRF